MQAGRRISGPVRTSFSVCRASIEKGAARRLRGRPCDL